MSRVVWAECGRDGKKDFIVFICISRFRCNLNLSSFLLLVALKGKGKKRILMVPLSEEKKSIPWERCVKFKIFGFQRNINVINCVFLSGTQRTEWRVVNESRRRYFVL